MFGLPRDKARAARAARLFAAVEKMPPGRQRDELLQKALQLEATAKVEGWINSPGLQPPIDANERVES